MTIRRQWHRWTRWGTLIGGGAMSVVIALPALAMLQLRCCSAAHGASFGAHLLVAVLTLVAAGVGAGVGAAIGTGLARLGRWAGRESHAPDG